MEEQAHSPRQAGRNVASALPLLNALGISAWVPRQPLQGNAPIHQYFAADTAATAATNARKASGATPTQNQAVGLQSQATADHSASVRDELLASVRGESIQKPTAAAKTPLNHDKHNHQQSQGDQLAGGNVVGGAVESLLENVVDEAGVNRFECLCLFYRDWVFIDDVSGTQIVKSAYIDWQLAILRALGLIGNSTAAGAAKGNKESAQSPADEESLRHRLPIRRLRWPPANDLDRKLAKSNNHDARNASVYSANARQEFVMGWMERQQSLLGREVNKVVLLGSGPQAFLAREPDGRSEGQTVEGHLDATPSFTQFEAQGALAKLFPKSQVLCAPASQQLWQSAVLKREFWLHLSQLLLIR